MDQPTGIGDLPETPIYALPRIRPVATYVILTLNVILFALTEVSGGSTDTDVLVQFGASFAPYFRRGEYWRLVMPMFLHIGWIHLLVNSYALYLLGSMLERVYGYGRYTFLYVGAGIAGSYVSMTVAELLDPRKVAAGASGAIFGIAGAMLITGYLHREVVPPRWGRAFGQGIIPLIVINLIFGFTVEQIDNAAHIGGLIGGALLAVVMPPQPRQASAASHEEARPSQAIVLVPLAVVLLAMTATGQRYWVSRKVTRLLQEAERLRVARQSERAVERLRAASRLAPTDARPHESLGSVYLERGRATDAIQEYQQALRLNPRSLRAQLGLAVVHEQQGDPAGAQALFRAAFGKAADTAQAHGIFADICAGQKVYAAAIRHYQEALRIDPNLAVIHNNLGWLFATSEDERFREPQLALKHARRAVELSRWREGAFIDTLAEALYVNQNFEEAVKVQTKALELEPRNREFQEHMERYRKAAGA